MKVAVIGGGFGLYGYLPALIDGCNCSVILPIRYKERILARDDVRRFADIIEWAADDEALLQDCKAVIIAVPPALQSSWVDKCLTRENITHLLLEKPVAATPELATELLNRLTASPKKFRIGYNFRQTDWGKDLLANSTGVQSINWTFRANHYAKDIPTWKRVHAEGGGALRFYGIHLIALLAEMGYDDVISSSIQADRTGEADSWQTIITGPNLPNCRVFINSNDAKTSFTVKMSDEQIVHLSHPFENNQEMGLMDQRIPFLQQVLLDLFLKDRLCYDWYGKANLLWSRIERRTSTT